MSEPITSIAVYAWIGWCVTTALLWVLWYLSGTLGALLFARLRRVYHLVVIGYWLDRLEKGGWRVFEKAEAEDKQKAAQRSKP